MKLWKKLRKKIIGKAERTKKIVKRRNSEKGEIYKNKKK